MPTQYNNFVNVMVQEREKREHREKQEAGSQGEKERERKSEPGFDGRWYTDTDSHTQHRDRYGWTSLLYTPQSFRRTASCLSFSIS